ncbi:MAG: hypothetical protein WCG45_02605 [bacterium]
MNEIKEKIKIKGDVQAIIEYDSGEIEIIEFPNTILATGKNAVASCLANEIGDSFNFYISRMIFGDGGTSGGSTKFVNANRNGLFGVTRASKPVIATIDPNISSQVIFTSVISKEEANGYPLNEMALKMANDDLYSMVTFPDLNKTNSMQITWNWRISMV